VSYLICSYNYLPNKDDVGFTGNGTFIFDPQNSTENLAPPPFWDTWPPILVTLLRYVLFGWLWMNWL